VAKYYFFSDATGSARTHLDTHGEPNGVIYNGDESEAVAKADQDSGCADCVTEGGVEKTDDEAGAITRGW